MTDPSPHHQRSESRSFPSKDPQARRYLHQRSYLYCRSRNAHVDALGSPRSDEPDPKVSLNPRQGRCIRDPMRDTPPERPVHFEHCGHPPRRCQNKRITAQIRDKARAHRPAHADPAGSGQAHCRATKPKARRSYPQAALESPCSWPRRSLRRRKFGVLRDGKAASFDADQDGRGTSSARSPPRDSDRPHAQVERKKARAHRRLGVH